MGQGPDPVALMGSPVVSPMLVCGSHFEECGLGREAAQTAGPTVESFTLLGVTPVPGTGSQATQALLKASQTAHTVTSASP